MKEFAYIDGDLIVVMQSLYVYKGPPVPNVVQPPDNVTKTEQL